LDEQESRFLYEALVHTIRNVRNDIFIVEARPLAGPGTDDERSALTRANACDGWFFITLGKAGENLSLGYRLYNSLAMEFAVRGSMEKPKPTIRDLVVLFWRDMAASLLELPVREALPAYVFHGIPGTRIYGLSGNKNGYVKLDETGIFRSRVALPGTYGIRAQKLGREPVEEQYFLKETGGDIYLDQPEGNRYTLGFSLVNLRFPELDFSYGIIPNSLYAQGGITLYYPGLGGPVQKTHKERPGIALFDFSLELKWYFSQPDKIARPYLGFGALARLTFANKFIDPIAPYGLFPVLGIDTSPSRKLRLFFEFQPVFYRFRFDEAEFNSITYYQYTYTQVLNSDGTFGYQVDAQPYVVHYLNDSIIRNYIGSDLGFLFSKGNWYLDLKAKIGLRWYF
jgi:hypothetical protein